MPSDAGKLRTIYVPAKLDVIIENTRGNLGLSRSAFYKYAITKLLQDLSVLTRTAQNEESE